MPDDIRDKSQGRSEILDNGWHNNYYESLITEFQAAVYWILPKNRGHCYSEICRDIGHYPLKNLMGY